MTVNICLKKKKARKRATRHKRKQEKMPMRRHTSHAQWQSSINISHHSSGTLEKVLFYHQGLIHTAQNTALFHKTHFILHLNPIWEQMNCKWCFCRSLVCACVFVCLRHREFQVLNSVQDIRLSYTAITINLQSHRGVCGVGGRQACF